MTSATRQLANECAITRATQGDAEAWSELYDAHNRGLVAYIAALGGAADPQDVAQEVWAQALRDLPALADPRAFPKWLRTIARRTVYRTTRTERLATRTLAPLPSPGCGDLTDDLIEVEDQARVWRAMDVIRPGARALLMERVVDEAPPGAIAARRAMTEGSVHVALTRSRKALRRAYSTLPSLVPAGVLLRWRRLRHSDLGSVDALVAFGAGGVAIAALGLGIVGDAGADPVGGPPGVVQLQPLQVHDRTSVTTPVDRAARRRADESAAVEAPTPMVGSASTARSEAPPSFESVAGVDGVADAGWHGSADEVPEGDVSMDTGRGRVDVYVRDTVGIDPPADPRNVEVPSQRADLLSP